MTAGSRSSRPCIGEKVSLRRRGQLRRGGRTYRQSLKGIHSMYLRHARERRIPFRLTRAQFAAFWQAPCHYCGYAIKTLGIDRVDNERGYVTGNVVSACKYCNRAKSDLSLERFLALCGNVVRRHGLVYAKV